MIKQWTPPAPRVLKPDEVRKLARNRLARFIRLERKYSRQLNEAGLRLVRHARFAAYLDVHETKEKP